MLNVLLFYSVYGAGFYASLLRNPVYAFVLYEAVYFFNPKGRWWFYNVPDISYSFFVVLLMMGVYLLNVKKANLNKLLKVPQFRWMYILVFLYAVTYFFAVTPQAHLDAAINFIKLAIIISIAYKLCDSVTKLNYILWGYLFGAWYIGFIAFQTGRNSGIRVEGIGTVDAPDANDIAAAIAPALVLCLYYFWTSDKWWVKSFMACAGIFIANGLVLINSRGAFLGAIASLVYFMSYMLFSTLQRKGQKSIAAMILVAGIAAGGVLMDRTFVDRMKSIYKAEVSEEQESAATRTLFWAAAWDMAKDHPFGAGHLGFNYYAPMYIPDHVHTGNSRNRTVHSTWFEALTEVGYIGFFVFILMVYSTFRTLGLCKKKLKEQGNVDEYFRIIAIQSGFIAFLIAMTFINRMRAEVLYWIILYTACLYNIYILTPSTYKSVERKNEQPQSGKPP